MQPASTAPAPRSPTARAAGGPRTAPSTAVVLAVLGAFGAVLVLNLVWHMGDQNLLDYDEGRHAVSAFEMWRSGDLLVNTYRGAPDYWNLKPPLSFWSIMASFQVFGPSTIALRLPSLLATVVTGAVLVAFAHRRVGARGAIVVAAVYATCYPLIGFHSGRSADPDALYVLFFTVGALSVLLAPEHPRFLLLWTTAFSAAFLTKSWHAGLVLVAGTIFLALRGRASAARWRDYAIALCGFIPVLAWAVARSSYDGIAFFRSMVAYDLLSRSSTVIEGHLGGPGFYLVELLYFVPWGLLLAVPLLAGAAARRDLGIGATLRAWRTSDLLGPVVFVVVIVGAFSAVASKLSWYIFPAMPPLILLIGMVAALLTRRATGRTAILSAVVVVVVAAQRESAVLTRIPLPEPAAQLALAQLDRAPHVRGDRIYVDRALHFTNSVPPIARIGDWPQALRASALLHAQLRPEDGGAAAFLDDAGADRLLLVRVGSATDHEVVGASTTVVASAGAYRVLRLTD